MNSYLKTFAAPQINPRVATVVAKITLLKWNMTFKERVRLATN